jgi:hypothetical protein
MDQPASLFNRLVSRPRRPWVTLGIALIFLLAALAAAYLDGALGDLFGEGMWRGMLLPPAVIVYILAVSPAMARMETGVLKSFRPVVLVDDDRYNRLIREATHIRPASEIIAFGAGALLGILMVVGSPDFAISWLAFYWLLSTSLMYGLLAWTIYGALAGTRLTAALLRQPLRVDPFDAASFEVIGRQSLLLALVFVGGITLSLLFYANQPELLRDVKFWLFYIPVALVTVLLFFLNMYPTHRVLASAKERELEAVQRHIQQAYRNLIQRLEENQDTETVAAEITALAAYDQRLQVAKTWPYNTSMLRALFVSALVPAVTALGRLVVDRLFG